MSLHDGFALVANLYFQYRVKYLVEGRNLMAMLMSFDINMKTCILVS